MRSKILAIAAIVMLATFAVGQTASATPAQEPQPPAAQTAPASGQPVPAQPAAPAQAPTTEAQPAQPTVQAQPPVEAHPPAQTPPPEAQAPAQPKPPAAKPTAPEKPPKYDVAKEVKLKGTIMELKQYHCPISGGLGAHFTVKSGDTVYEVHLSSVKFTKDYSIELAQGAAVEMVGNKVEYNGVPAFLPREITIANVTYFVRDKAGKPLW
jgi:hypothetical protein